MQSKLVLWGLFAALAGCAVGVEIEGSDEAEQVEALAAPPPPIGAENCTNGVDDNGNGQVDCDDPACGNTNQPCCRSGSGNTTGMVGCSDSSDTCVEGVCRPPGADGAKCTDSCGCTNGYCSGTGGGSECHASYCDPGTGGCIYVTTCSDEGHGFTWKCGNTMMRGSAWCCDGVSVTCLPGQDCHTQCNGGPGVNGGGTFTDNECTQLFICVGAAPVPDSTSN